MDTLFNLRTRLPMPPPIALVDFFLELPRRVLLNHRRGRSQLPFRYCTRRLSYSGSVDVDITPLCSPDSHWPFLHQNHVSRVKHR